MKKILTTGLIIAISFLAGCGVNNNANANVDDVDFSIVGRDGYMEVFRDNETKVNYVVYTNSRGIGICPRYNNDGTIYTD